MISKMLEVGDIIRWSGDPPGRNFLITKVNSELLPTAEDYEWTTISYNVLDLSTNNSYTFYADQLHNKAFINKVA